MPIYCSGEPYVEAEWGIRVQKIGSHLRVYKKLFTGSGWKSQFGGSSLVNVDPDDPEFPKYQAWADAVSSSPFGQGMEMFAIDALHTAAGEDVIIELNGTAIGFHTDFYEEDSGHVKEVVCEKMQAVLDERERQRAPTVASGSVDADDSSAPSSSDSSDDPPPSKLKGKADAPKKAKESAGKKGKKDGKKEKKESKKEKSKRKAKPATSSDSSDSSDSLQAGDAV
jgi:Synapsin, ATP binding domain